MKDIHQSLKYGQYMEKIGWRTEIIDGCQIFLRKVPFFGSIIKIQRSPSIPFVKLDQLAKSQRAFLVSVEPQTEELVPQLLQHGFRRNNGAMIPSKTRQIDLIPNEKEIFQSFNRTRKYKINKAKRNNFQIRIENSGRIKGHSLAPDTDRSRGKGFSKGWPYEAIDDFVNLWSQNALSRGFWVPIKDQIRAMYEVFGKDAFLILTYQEQNLIAGILLIIEEKTAHYSDSSRSEERKEATLPKVASYFYAASNETGRKLCAPSLLTWEAMKLAKNKGCTVFDFEGIYDERFPQKSWQGFSYFKESFGGKIVSYSGRFIKTQGLLSRLLFP